MQQIMVLGAGLVGSFIAKELSRDFEVIVIDINEESLSKLPDNIKVKKLAIDPFAIHFYLQKNPKPDVVVNALPGWLGYIILEELIKNKCNVVDIAFMLEDPLQLDKLAKENDTTAVVDFGLAPGLSHMFVKRSEIELGKLAHSTIWVGGLTKNTDDYKAVFSPQDVIEEYTRPARYFKDGKIVIEEPFKNIYMYETHSKWIECISEWRGEYNNLVKGTYPDNILYGFISDGLRTLLKTSNIPNLVEYTLRTPKHFMAMKYMKEAGFFKEPDVQFTSHLLIDGWKMKEEDRDYSLITVVSYKENIYDKALIYNLYDEYNEKTQDHSMARTTGYPAIAMVKLIASGQYTERGVVPPEKIAENDLVYSFIIRYLKDKGIIINKVKNYVNGGNIVFPGYHFPLKEQE